jgi:hypothetical protein
MIPKEEKPEHNQNNYIQQEKKLLEKSKRDSYESMKVAKVSL